MKILLCLERIKDFVLPLALSSILLAIQGNDSFGQQKELVLNDQEYYEMRGFNVLAFENAYTGFFFDEKTSGIMFIHHGVRTATGGAVRLKPTPEQWDQIPVLVERKVKSRDNSIDILLRYEDFDFESRVKIQPESGGLRIRVFLEEPLPEVLRGRAGFNIEFLPSSYFEKTYLMDDRMGIFPLYPSDNMKVMPESTQLRQFGGHSTFDDRGLAEYVEPLPFARGTRLIMSPEDPMTRIRIESMEGDLCLYDGRNVAQNGWFVVRSILPEDKKGKVVEWLITPSVINDWVRDPVIGYSQAGYDPDQDKIAVIELDRNDVMQKTASVLKLNEEGQWDHVFEAEVNDWGEFYRYHYGRFDFSEVAVPGLYRINYGDKESGVIRIGEHVYDDGWQSTLDVWFPVQMDHMFVNEAYRVWHGAAHLDDALQAPINHRHFDGYAMGDTTETRYKPGERIPGLDIGGWFDAGDFDIRTGSHCNTVLSLVESWEHFGLMRDETRIDQKQRFVDIHRPDGKPDLLQQIEHGTLALVAQHRAFGRAIPGIIVPNLHQYHHLGDGSTMTDNLPFNPDLAPYESDRFSSGTPDDRWAFTSRMAVNSYASVAALAAASRALRGYNDELAAECISFARMAFEDEQGQPVEQGPGGRSFGRAGEIRALLQLFITTGERRYADQFEEKLWPGLDNFLPGNIGFAAQALPYMDSVFNEKLRPYVEKYKSYNDELLNQNPYGVPISTGGWAGNAGVIRWAISNYLLNKYYPGVIGPEYTFRGMDYIYGCHPYSNISFVSGIGVHSKKIAYGSNRADYSFIAGGVVPGVLVIKPDYPENKNDWPFLWGENEYVIDICAEYIMLVNAIIDLAGNEE